MQPRRISTELPINPSGSAVGDATLLPTLSITIDPSLAVTTVEGLLFNGLVGTDSFLVQAFSGSALVDSVSLDDLAANLGGGFDVFRLASGGATIDLVTIDADLAGPFPGEWDFFIDTLAINEPIENVVAVSEPATLALIAIGLTVFGVRSQRRRRLS